jgi:hypothetical protein
MNRRQFLLAASAPLASAAPAWNAGNVVHLLPGVSSHRLVLKASFNSPLATAPRLALDNQRPVPGQRGDSKGLYWSFDIANLEPARRYTLQLTSSNGKPLCDPWPLRTLPSPQDRPQRLRVAIYTCAGGHEKIHDGKGNGAFLPLHIRRRFLDRIAALQPDAVIAIGDHVYWDQRSIVGRPGNQDQQQIDLAGKFDRSLPIFGTPNETALLRATAPQIAELYGTVFRSTPVYFVQDDHDYFDNDEASDALVTLPPDAFMLRAGRATRRLFYPEFLPDSQRPNGLAGSYEFEPQQTLAECYGTLRWGNLAELLIYDCRRHLSLSGPSAGFIPETAEQWLLDRTRSKDTAHLVHIPSVPFGWSAGKWGDWYADVLDASGKLTIDKRKPYWQAGWRAQHDRILTALAANRDRKPLLISGDLHSHALARIHRSGKLDVSTNPVNVAIAGPISTASTGWPSAARGTLAQSAIGLEMDTRVPVVEHNGFTIADFTPNEVRWSFYGWKAGSKGPTAIDSLTPFHTETF